MKNDVDEEIKKMFFWAFCVFFILFGSVYRRRKKGF